MKIRKPSGSAVFAWGTAYVLALVWLFSTISQFIYLDAPMPWRLDVLLFLSAAAYTTVAALLEKKPNIVPTIAVAGYCVWVVRFWLGLRSEPDGDTFALAFLLLVAAVCGSFSVSWTYAGIMKRLRSLPPISG